LPVPGSKNTVGWFYRPMPLPIVHYNAPVLRKKGDRITTFDRELARLADDLVEAMRVAKGIGLAAQQVGRAVQLCVVDLRGIEPEFTWELDGARPPLELFMPLALVNPVVTAVPAPTTTYEEGCLSFPDIRGDVVRPDRITVKFQDPHGHLHSLTATGLLSRCVQHEVDHLHGVLFIDRMEEAVLESLTPALKALKKRTREALKAAKL